MKATLIERDYLTVSEIKTYLNISQSKAYELTHRKDFPVTKLGGTIRIPRNAFLCWLELHTAIPAELSF